MNKNLTQHQISKLKAKPLIAFILILFATTLLKAQSPSNDCSTGGGQQLTVNSSCSAIGWNIGTSIGAPALPACGGSTGTGQDGWGWFTATSTATTITYTPPVNRDAALYIYTDNGTGCSGLTVVACADAGGNGTVETVNLASVIGTRYYVRVVRKSGSFSSMNGTICVWSCTLTNDNPCGATALTIGTSCSWSTYNTNCATPTVAVANPSCANYAGDDVWFTAVVPASGRLVLDSRRPGGGGGGGINDGGMALYSATGCAGTFTELFCDDDASANGLMPYISASGLTPGSTVYIRFWAKNNAQSGSFRICAYDPCGGAGSTPNDNPCAATAITVNSSCSYTSYTTNCPTATSGVPAPTCGSYINGDVWFSLTVPASGYLNIDSREGTIVDGAMALYSATSCSGPFTELQCDDDNSVNGLMPALNLSGLTAGSVVYLRFWDRSNSATGTFEICAYEPSCTSAPTNDLPCSAVNLPIGVTLNGDNTCAYGTGEPGNPSCWSSSGTLNTMWYSIICPASGTIRVRTYLGTLQNTQIALYSGSCSALTILGSGCNDNAAACPGAPTVYYSELNVSGLSAGTIYYLRIDGYQSQTGTFNVTVTDGSPFSTIPQQDCLSPTLICSQITTVGDPGFVGGGNVCDFTTPYNCYGGGGERNSVYYYFNVSANGTLVYDIIPNLASTDYDWMLWNITGMSQAAVCSGISAKTLGTVRCSFSADPDTTGLRPGYVFTSEGASGSKYCAPLGVLSGERYLLMITNYSANNTGFKLDFLSSSPLVYSTPTTLVWTGGISTDWFNAQNWGGCAIPDCGRNAVIVNGPANQPVIANNASVRTLTIDPGSSVTIAAGIQLQVCGDYNNNGELNASTTSTILFNNAITQNINGNLIGNSRFGNLRVTNPSTIVNLNQDIEIGGNFFVANSASIFRQNGRYIKLSGNFFNANGSTSFTTVTNGTLELNGLSAQAFDNQGGAISIYNVFMNHKGTGVTLASSTASMNIAGTLTLTDGKIITANNNEVYVTNSAANAVNSGNVNSYIEGRLRRNIATSTGNYYLPVGNAMMGYELAEINYTTAPLLAYNLLTTFNNWGTVPNGPLSNDCPNKNYSSFPALNHGYWTINASSALGIGTYNVTLNNLYYTNSTGTFWTVMKRNPSGIGVWGLNGTCNAGSTATATRRDGLSGFSDFASIQWSNPLPIELMSFNVVKNAKSVDLVWRTATEHSNDYFTIQRSTDRINYEDIGSVKGAGTSTSVKEYSFTDIQPLKGQSYYRLKQTDFNGDASFSNTKQVDFGNGKEKVVIYPNPASKSFNCQFNAEEAGLIEISIADLTEKEIEKYRAQIHKGLNKIPVDITSIPDGVYFVKVKSAEGISSFFEYNTKFIKSSKLIK